jgi:hypothetical protein
MEDEILGPASSSGDPGQGRNRGRGNPSAKCRRQGMVSRETRRVQPAPAGAADEVKWTRRGARAAVGREGKRAAKDGRGFSF